MESTNLSRRPWHKTGPHSPKPWWWLVAGLLLSGCATPQHPFKHGDSGRMGVQLYHAGRPLRSEFEVVFATGPAASFGACVAVSVSTDGVKTLQPCENN